MNETGRKAQSSLPSTREQTVINSAFSKHVLTHGTGRGEELGEEIK